MNVFCKLFGHDWKGIYPVTSAGSLCMVCKRCKKNGWLLR